MYKYVHVCIAYDLFHGGFDFFLWERGITWWSLKPHIMSQIKATDI